MHLSYNRLRASYSCASTSAAAFSAPWVTGWAPEPDASWPVAPPLASPAEHAATAAVVSNTSTAPPRCHRRFLVAITPLVRVVGHRGGGPQRHRAIRLLAVVEPLVGLRAQRPPVQPRGVIVHADPGKTRVIPETGQRVGEHVLKCACESLV